MPEYFSKVNPRQAVVLSNGVGLQFESVDRDTGIFATEDPSLIREMHLCIARHAGGLSVISAEEFKLLRSKKKDISTPRWREELSPGMMQKLRAQSPTSTTLAHGASPVAGADVVRVATPNVMSDEFRPTASR